MINNQIALPMVSILIPTYNRAATLVEAVKSALAQDYANLEVIVSDNASTDNTDKVIAPFLCDTRLCFIRQETNRGPAENWTRLLQEYASGEWAIFLASDDFFLDKSYISKAIDIVSGNAECRCCHADLRYLYESLGTHRDTKKQCPRIADGSWYFWDHDRSVKIHISNFLFHRDTALGLGAVRSDPAEKASIGGDSELIGKFLLVGKVGFVDTVANAYRLHGANDTFSADLLRIINFFDCIDRTHDFGVERHPYEARRFRVWRIRQQEWFIASYFTTLAKRDKRKTLGFLVKTFRCHPVTTVRAFLRPVKFVSLIFWILLPTVIFRRVQDRYSSHKSITH
jgi:glycosyltransferase involved in cell wall biosynthesis